MHHQNDTLQSTGETVHLRLDLLHRMQLPIDNILFTSFIISDSTLTFRSTASHATPH